MDYGKRKNRNTLDIHGSIEQREQEKCDECPICFQEFVYKTELPNCGHNFCFLCIKGVTLRQGSCPICRNRIPCGIFRDPLITTLTTPQIAIGTTTDANSLGVVAEHTDGRKNSAEKAHWFYGARCGSWWRYERRHESEIEKCYQDGLHSIDLLIAGNLFCIDFDSMCQYRKDFGRRRKFDRPIKRIEKENFGLDSNVLGIAGLRTPTERNANVKQGMSKISK